MVSTTMIGLILILNTTMVLATTTALLVCGTTILKEQKKPGR